MMRFLSNLAQKMRNQKFVWRVKLLHRLKALASQSKRWKDTAKILKLKTSLLRYRYCRKPISDEIFFVDFFSLNPLLEDFKLLLLTCLGEEEGKGGGEPVSF